MSLNILRGVSSPRRESKSGNGEVSKMPLSQVFRNKVGVAVGSLGVISAMGCATTPDPKIAELEKRLAAVEKTNSDLLLYKAKAEGAEQALEKKRQAGKPPLILIGVAKFPGLVLPEDPCDGAGEEESGCGEEDEE